MIRREQNKGFPLGDARVKKLTPASIRFMLNFDVRVKNSDAAQPSITNVKTPNDDVLVLLIKESQ